MFRTSALLHRFAPFAVALAFLLAPRAARAQAGFDTRNWNLDLSGLEVLIVGGTVLAGAYVVGGSLAFATLDAVHFARRKPFPRSLRWLQVGYGASLLAIGAIAAEAHAPPEVVTPFLVGGAVFISVPLLEWGGRDQSPGTRTQLSLGPTGVRVAGAF